MSTDKIVLKKDGLYKFFWDDGQHTKKIDSLIPYLRDPLEIERGITFETFFNYVWKDADLVNVIFSSHLGHYDLNKWKDEWKKKGIKKEYENQKTYNLEISWAVEICDDEISEWVDFSGVGKYFNTENKKWYDTGIGFSFVPLNEMKLYELKINTDWKLFDLNSKKTKNYEDGILINSKKMLSVYDVIGAILFEISWYGPPKNRNEEENKLNNMSDEIDIAIKEGRLDEITTSVDSVDDLFDEK